MQIAGQIRAKRVHILANLALLHYFDTILTLF